MSGAAYLGEKNTNIELSIAGNTTVDAAKVLATKARLKHLGKLKNSAAKLSAKSAVATKSR